MEVRLLESDKFDAAARLFADAFLDDPGWVAVGPDSPGRRHANLRRYHRKALAVIQRYGGPIYGAFDDGGAAGEAGGDRAEAAGDRAEAAGDRGAGGGAAGDGGGPLVGVAATFAAGLYPPPAWTIVYFVPGFVLAGPGPIVRGLRFSAVQEKGHPEDGHVYLWFLAVDPRHQRGGIGRALLARVHGDATAPVYLDTANPANVPYYASNGYEELGRADGPRGASMWFMRRPR